jgi:hypothetical protein
MRTRRQRTHRPRCTIIAWHSRAPAPHWQLCVAAVAHAKHAPRHSNSPLILPHAAGAAAAGVAREGTIGTRGRTAKVGARPTRAAALRPHRQRGVDWRRGGGDGAAAGPGPALHAPRAEQRPQQEHTTQCASKQRSGAGSCPTSGVRMHTTSLRLRADTHTRAHLPVELGLVGADRASLARVARPRAVAAAKRGALAACVHTAAGGAADRVGGRTSTCTLERTWCTQVVHTHLCHRTVPTARESCCWVEAASH